MALRYTSDSRLYKRYTRNDVYPQKDGINRDEKLKKVKLTKYVYEYAKKKKKLYLYIKKNY